MTVNVLNAPLNKVQTESLNEVIKVLPTINKDRLVLQNSAVEYVINHLVKEKQFYMGGIRRQINRHIFKQLHTVEEEDYIIKPDGLEVEDMFYANPSVFGCGEEKLNENAHRLKVDRIAYYHSRICHKCKWDISKQRTTIADGCYMKTLIKTITHGWQPKMNSYNFIPPYKSDGNYLSTKDYSESVDKEVFETMKGNGVIQESKEEEGQVVHPLGAVVKNSDITRAEVVAGIHVKHQESLNEANKLLISQGHNKIKVRVSTDCTGTGVNAEAYSPRFSYPSFRDAIRIIEKDCYMGITDVGRYFYSFPWAKPMRKYMKFRWGKLYEYLALCFGFTTCPYYTSTWSAEFRRWAMLEFKDCAHMVDDWFFVASTERTIIQRCLKWSKILVDCGFHMAPEKNTYGQQVKYLGVLLDSVSMTMRIDPLQAKGTRHILHKVYGDIKVGNPIEAGTINHLAGKLNWFAEFIQSGRLHNTLWWRYMREILQEGSKTFSEKEKLLVDITWWMDILLKWSSAEDSELQYKILSASALATNPESIMILQSDASGEDGIGYLYGHRNEKDPNAVSIAWPPDSNRDSTHIMELFALLQFMSQKGNKLKDVILIWVTDSTGAALSVNNGSCKNPIGLQYLTEIFRACDIQHVEIVAVWIPRELNTISDFLSHFSVMLNRQEWQGHLHDVERFVESRRQVRTEDKLEQTHN